MVIDGEENGGAQSKLMPRNHTLGGDRADEICRRIDWQSAQGSRYLGSQMESKFIFALFSTVAD